MELTLPPQAVPPDAVHLWWAVPDVNALPGLLPYLSEAETAAANRFVFERHRVLYAFAHGVLRVTLAAYTGVDPRALEFESVGNGRPELRDRAVRFNLSHTAGLVLIGVAAADDVGVDAEVVEAKRGRDERLAARVFTPRELAAWQGEPVDARPAGFFDRWTLKEAYIKARGDGLSLELRSFGFPRLGERPVIESDFGDAGEWQFFSFAPTSEHRAAAALRTDRHVTWSVVPLAPYFR